MNNLEKLKEVSQQLGDFKHSEPVKKRPMTMILALMLLIITAAIIIAAELI